MRIDLFRRLSVLTLLVLGGVAVRGGDGSVNLAWDSSPTSDTTSKVASYIVYYARHPLTNITPGGPVDGTITVKSVGNSTNATISGLLGGNKYFFTVAAKDFEGQLSEFCDPIDVVVPRTGLLADLPPLTEGMDLTVPTPPPGNFPNTGSVISPAPVNNNPAQLNLVGLLPRMWMSRTNGSPLLTVGGAIGATFTIQTATNVTGFEEWTTVTNIKMSAIAPNTTEPTGNALNRAFIPSLESWADMTPSTNEAGIKFYRIYMPFGYAVVADQVLKPKGFNTRLVAIRLAALNAYIVCYVTEEGVYLDYNDETFIVKTEQSGRSIREIATKVASVLGQNWTSASEFTVNDGLKQILATVVQTDSPLSDPPLGSTGGVSIAIDF